MSVATFQQISKDLPSSMVLVQQGENAIIPQAGEIVARLMPPPVGLAKKAPADAPVNWQNFAARRRAIFGKQMLPLGTAQALVEEDRGA